MSGLKTTVEKAETVRCGVAEAKSVDAEVFLYYASSEYVEEWAHTGPWNLVNRQVRFPCVSEVWINISYEITGVTKPSIRKTR